MRLAQKLNSILGLKKESNELIKLKINIYRRVWSWLRTNAGGMPNTCKSNGPYQI